VEGFLICRLIIQWCVHLRMSEVEAHVQTLQACRVHMQARRSKQQWLLSTCAAMRECALPTHPQAAAPCHHTRPTSIQTRAPLPCV